MLRTALDIVWRTVLAALVFAGGLVASRLGAQLLGFGAPRMPAQAPEAIAGWYLLAGSLVLAAILALPASGLGAGLVARCCALFVFLFVGFGVSSTVETALFSSAEGVLRMIPVLALPCLLLAAAEALLVSAPGEAAADRRTAARLGSRSAAQWGWRLLAASLAFPVLYFALGILVSPLVRGFYAGGVAGLALPDVSILLVTQVGRGVVHTLIALPLILLWAAGRRRLVVALGLSFFAFVLTYDVVLAYRVPAVLLLVHGVEVLVSSLLYAGVLVALLAPGGYRSSRYSATAW